MNIIAHRGDTTNAIDNTMDVFQQAYEANVYGIEFDVRGTADDIPVIHHHMEITHDDQTSFIQDHTYDQLTQITPSADGQPYQIPAFQEVLATFCGKIYLEVHIQSFRRQTVETITRMLKPYQKYWDMIELTSFEPAILLACHDCCPGIARDFLFSPADWMTDEIVTRIMIDKAKLGLATGIHLFPDQVTEPTVRHFQKHGFSVHCGVVNDPSVAKHITALGVNQFCTDNIYLFI